MPEPTPNKAATRESLESPPLPGNHANLELSKSLTDSEFELAKTGLVPEAMEDKWFIFFEGGWLYFYRSWTATCIYAVRFKQGPNGVSTVESWVNRDSTQYKETRVDYDRAILEFLIDALLLKKPAAFPVPSNLPLDAPKGLYQHAIVGREYPEISFPAGSCTGFFL